MALTSLWRTSNTKRNGSSFDEAAIEAVWQKATVIPGYTVVRRDACGTLIARHLYGKLEPMGWEIDHKQPVSMGGSDDLSNLQPLQWENNRHKGDNYPLWTCKYRN